MQIQCPSCKKQYTVDGSRVTEQGVKIACPACQHLFIIRKKQEPKSASKLEPPKRKTPPCAICGEPSARILPGPPPRPLCEHHFQIEKEIDSRFFEDEGVKPDAGSSRDGGQSPGSTHPNFGDPGATRISREEPPAPTAPVPGKVPPPPGVTRGTGAPITMPPPSPRKGAEPALPHPVPRLSESAFESFDDFDFADMGMSSPAPAPKPAPKPAAEKDAFTASPFEFMDELTAANAPAPAPPGQETPDEADLFRPPADTAPPRKAAVKAEEVAPLDFESDSFQPERGADEDFASATMPANASFNLDGSEAEASRHEPEEFDSFAWETGSRAAPAQTRLDEEMATAAEPAAPAVLSSARPSGRVEAEVGIRSAKPRGRAAAAVAAALLVLVTGAAVFFSWSGWADNPPATAEELAVPAMVWEGERRSAGEAAMAPAVAANLPSLVVEGQEQGAGAVSAAEHGQKAMSLAFADTAAGFESALKEIEQATAMEPRSGRYQALRIDILGLRETLGIEGRPVSASRCAAAAAALPAGLVDDPLLLRAKAHAFLNDNKTAAAKALLNNYLAVNPSDGMALYLQAMTFKYQPRPDLKEAARILEEAVAAEPRLVRAFWELAALDRELGQYRSAIDIYNRILTAFPDRAGTAEAMEETLREQSDGAGAAGTPSPVLIISPQPEAPPAGIAGAGNAISINILEAIEEVESKMRQLKIPPAGNAAPVSNRPERPKPPEEAQ